jgi:hypothetical protein
LKGRRKLLTLEANLRLRSCAKVVSEPQPVGAPNRALRSAPWMYRNSPRRSVSQHLPYFHNGTAWTLEQRRAALQQEKRSVLER